MVMAPLQIALNIAPVLSLGTNCQVPTSLQSFVYFFRYFVSKVYRDSIAYLFVLLADTS